MALGINTVAHWGKYSAEEYPNFELSDFARPTRQLNFVSFKFPQSPLLTQLEDVPEKEICDPDETLAARDECIKEYCSCIQTLKIELGQVSWLVSTQSLSQTSV